MLPAEDEMMKWPSFDGRFYYGKVFASVLKNINFVLIKSVIYGKKEDGSLDANFLTKGTPSFEQYYVLGENGEIVQSLHEYDEQLQQMKSSGKKM